MRARWQLYPQIDYSNELLNSLGADSLLARLLVNRGITETSQAAYYIPQAQLNEISPLEIPEMDKAFRRVKEAIDKKQSIVIYGDYDVDGTSSVALLYRAFQMIGVKVVCYIPSRQHEGYGLNKTAIYKLRDAGTNLLISCDCGISNYDEVAYANSLGLDVIVTDHHSLPAVQPPSIANCNPKTLPDGHPLHHLPGVGVAYKLAELILEHYSKDHLALSRSLLDLVALGMIADMAALRSENRLLTKRGLEVLARTTKPGLRELLKLSGALRETNTEHIGFGMAPRINAAGRLADAFRAVELMTTEDQARAEELAKELDAENIERQVLCEQHFDEALNLIALERCEDDACIVLAQEGWHHGVIGIVASRIVDRFHLPVFIMAVEGNLAKGSVRSIDVDNLDIFEEMQAVQSKHQIFTKFGGHRAAAGFSIESSRINELKSILKQHFKQRLGEHNLAKTLRVDSALMLSELDFDFLARIESLAPYGIGNPSPLFVAGPLTIRSWRRLGKDAKHIKLALSQNTCIGREKIPANNKSYEALIWQRAEEFLKYIAAGNDELVAVFSIKSSEYMGEKSLQLEIRDWKLPAEVDVSLFVRFANKYSYC